MTRSAGSSAPVIGPPPVQLLLPCPDGAFPYLTPDLLSRCFPARRFPHLALGIAVRDACVVPAQPAAGAAAAATPRQPPSEGEGSKDEADNLGDNVPVIGTGTAKPGTGIAAATSSKGYAFAASQHGIGRDLVDPWLRGYRRVVVPTFDRWDDDDETERDPVRGDESEPNGPKGAPTKKKKKGAGRRAPPPNAGRVTNDRIWVGTPHGRLPLTAPAYAESAAGCVEGTLSASSVVPLYDAIPTHATTVDGPSRDRPDDSATTSTSTAPTSKRKRLAVQRSQNWYRQFVQQQQQQQSDAEGSHNKGKSALHVLFPVLLDPAYRGWGRDDSTDADEARPSGSNEADNDEDLLLSQLLESGPDGGGAGFGGSVLIGWHALDSDQRHRARLRWHEHQSRQQATAQGTGPVPAIAEPGARELEGTPMEAPAPIVVLKTKSLAQFVDAALLGVGGASTTDLGRPHPHVLVGCDLPAKWARQHKAFVVRLPPLLPGTAPEAAKCDDAPAPKRPKIDPNADVSNEAVGRPNQEQLLDENGCVDLSPGGKDDGDVHLHPWFRDLSPLVEGCRCTTCRHHTRAYVYHLVCAKELLGEVLLFVHNLHHMLAVVSHINELSGGSDRGPMERYLADLLPT